MDDKERLAAETKAVEEAYLDAIKDIFATVCLCGPDEDGPEGKLTPEWRLRFGLERLREFRLKALSVLME